MSQAQAGRGRIAPWGVAFAGALLLALAGFAPAAVAQQEDIVARRGNDVVTLTQARNLVANLDEKTRAQVAANPSLLSGMLRDYLLTRAILEEAAAEKWADRPEVQEALNRLRERLIGESFLASKSQPPKEFPSDAELQAFYDTNKQKFLSPRSYHLTQIFISADAGDQPAAKTALAKLRAGLGKRDFAKAASGVKGAVYQDFGWLPEDRIVEPVRGVTKGLPEGAVSDPVCTPGGCHLLKLVDTRPAGPAPLAAIRDQLVQAMRQSRQRELATAYQQAMLGKTPVQVNEIALDKAAAK